MVPLSSWGRLSAHSHRVLDLAAPQQAAHHLPSASLPGIAYGMGRSYGDVCLNPGGTIWKTNNMDHCIAYDAATGRLRCEAGVLLGDIQRLCLPRGWCLPVTPGTQMVTVGGAIANDVHGKNHHRKGSFGQHILSIKLARTDGRVMICTPEMHADWLAATIGGLGLTGMIVEAEIQLCPTPGPWLATETIAYKGIDAFFALADSSEKDWEYTVSWIDCLSGPHFRGLFMRANPTDKIGKTSTEKAPLTMPITPPFSLVNKLSLRPFNWLYYYVQTLKPGRAVCHYQPFFYPLDHIQHWNRLYGPRGFYQYQMVVPRSAGCEVITNLLRLITKSGQGSFLAVLKTFGAQPAPGLLSFPRHGVTLALDFPNQGNKTRQLFEQMDQIVLAAGGRLYPAKDARMSAATFSAGYSQSDAFKAYRDPGISSGFSRRVMGS